MNSPNQLVQTADCKQQYFASLVGGWATHSKNIKQIGSSPKDRGENKKMIETTT